LTSRMNDHRRTTDRHTLTAAVKSESRRDKSSTNKRERRRTRQLYAGQTKSHPRPQATSCMTVRWASKETHPLPMDRRSSTEATWRAARRYRSSTIARTRHQDNEETQSTVAAPLWTQTAASTPTGHHPHHSTVEAHPRPSDPGTSTVAIVSKRGVGQQRRRDEHSVFRLHSSQRHRRQSTRGVCPDEMWRAAVVVHHIRLRRAQ
jgi:hypothetical protein